MYRYFQPAGTPEDSKQQQELLESIKKHHIEGELKTYKDEKDLADQLKNMPDSINTVVMIGGDVDFENLIGQAKLLSKELAVGFLPTQNSRIAEKMQLKNWNDGVAVLAQRRIAEVIIFSIGNRFFFDQAELKIEKVETDLPLTITADQILRLRSPQANLKFENVSSEQFRAKSPLQLELFTISSNESTLSPFLELRRRLKKDLPTHTRTKIGQLHAKTFSVESAANLSDSYSRSFGSHLEVGKHTKTLRLITKRNTQL